MPHSKLPSLLMFNQVVFWRLHSKYECLRQAHCLSQANIWIHIVTNLTYSEGVPPIFRNISRNLDIVNFASKLHMRQLEPLTLVQVKSAIVLRKRHYIFLFIFNSPGLKQWDASLSLLTFQPNNNSPAPNLHEFYLVSHIKLKSILPWFSIQPNHHKYLFLAQTRKKIWD